MDYESAVNKAMQKHKDTLERLHKHDSGEIEIDTTEITKKVNKLKNMNEEIKMKLQEQNRFREKLTNFVTEYMLNHPEFDEKDVQAVMEDVAGDIYVELEMKK